MNTWGMIDNQFNKVMRPFYDQVDKTRKRLNLTPFKMIDPLSKTELDDVVIVTENRSYSHIKRIIAGLMSAKWQGVVEGQITDSQAHKIEMFNEASLQQADEYLQNEYGLPGLDVWLDNHVCHTGLIGVQWMVDIENGEYKIHCRPNDMRWTPFVLNKWVAPITFGTKEDLLKELEDCKKLAMDGGSDYEFTPPAEGTLKDIDNEVRDFWNNEVNELWINEVQVFRQRNTYGKLPHIILWVPSGFYFRDKGYLEHESPGLLAGNEALYEQLSQQLTIDATLGFNVLNPATEYESENPEGGLSTPRPKRGEDLEVPKGGRHIPFPNPDINRAELASREQVTHLIEEGSPIAPRGYATPPSAIEVTTEVELLDQLQNPQIIALQMFKSQLVRLNIEQTLLLAEKDGSISVGPTGKQGSFNIGDLKDPKKYSISYQLMKQNKRLAIVNEARALALWGKAPMKYILKDILSVEDPDGWMREMELERAKAVNPAIGLAEMAVRYAEEAEGMEGDDKELKNFQSMMIVHEYVMLLRQRMNPLPTGEAQDLREATLQTGNSQGLISMMGQAAKGGAVPTVQKGVIQ